MNERAWIMDTILMEEECSVCWAIILYQYLFIHIKYHID
jgi:hypothetical protein